jgi:hypothetical protein
MCFLELVLACHIFSIRRLLPRPDMIIALAREVFVAPRNVVISIHFVSVHSNHFSHSLFFDVSVDSGIFTLIRYFWTE